MMSRRFITLPAVAVSVAVLAGCTDHFEVLNTPPIEVTEVNPGFLLTGAQRWEARSGGAGNFHWFNLRNAGSWAQHWGETQLNNGNATYYNDGQRRNEEEVWVGTYVNILKNLRMAESLLRDMTDGDEQAPLVRTRLAQLRIFEVVSWERLTAVFGDIPFSEAAAGFEGTLTPVYDAQQDIYPALLAQIDQNVGRLTQGDVTFGSADLLYGGNVENWRRFANSLKLRTAMRMSYADPEAARVAVTAAMGQPLISNHAQTAQVQTGPGGAQVFHLHGQVQHLRNPVTIRLNQTLLDVLMERDDPRLPRIADPTPASVAAGNPEYKGLRVNVTLQELLAFDIAHLSQNAAEVYRNEDEYNPPMPVLTWANVLFLQAEAALRGWGATPAEAEGFFRQGIQAAMTMEPYHTIAQADIDRYIADYGNLSPNFEEALEQIAIEKWINHHQQNFELWFEWRRLSYPRLDPGNGGMGVTNNTIPRRAYWHAEEVTLNAANFQAAEARQGPNLMTTRMWIDANPHNGQSITY